MPFVVAVRVRPVVLFVTVKATSRTTAPVGSVTAPFTVARPCENADCMVRQTIRHPAGHHVRHPSICTPPSVLSVLLLTETWLWHQRHDFLLVPPVAFVLVVV